MSQDDILSLSFAEESVGFAEILDFMIAMHALAYCPRQMMQVK